MAIKWEGKSRGTLLGYKIFVFLIKHTGLGSAYFLLCFVALYFTLFSSVDRDVIYQFYRKRLGYGKLKSLWGVYKNFFVFGQTIIDKVAIFSNAKLDFTVKPEGEEYLKEMVAAGKGGMIISAHIGNFEVAGHFLKRLHTKVNQVTTNAEHAKIKDYLESVMVNQRNSYIVVKNDMTHIFEIDTALKNNELICFTGDRYYDKSKTVTAKLFGKEAHFPAGPFHLTTRFKIPYSFVFAMKGGYSDYHFYATPVKVNEGSIEAMVNEFTQTLESIILKYPEQWFNYYNFWAT